MRSAQADLADARRASTALEAVLQTAQETEARRLSELVARVSCLEGRAAKTPATPDDVESLRASVAKAAADAQARGDRQSEAIQRVRVALDDAVDRAATQMQSLAEGLKTAGCYAAQQQEQIDRLQGQIDQLSATVAALQRGRRSRSGRRRSSDDAALDLTGSDVDARS
ncbi:hypothetical protein PINS_up016461 [Pythium insidiosum]|nr:hypothetical protein PINS_up016461 [Pythium insidiosum]